MIRFADSTFHDKIYFDQSSDKIHIKNWNQTRNNSSFFSAVLKLKMNPNQTPESPLSYSNVVLRARIKAICTRLSKCSLLLISQYFESEMIHGDYTASGIRPPMNEMLSHCERVHLPGHTEKIWLKKK